MMYHRYDRVVSMTKAQPFIRILSQLQILSNIFPRYTYTYTFNCQCILRSGMKINYNIIRLV